MFLGRLEKGFQIQECFSIISLMLCHADSRLEQTGRCAFILREKGVQGGKRMRPGDGGKDGEGRDRGGNALL